MLLPKRILQLADLDRLDVEGRDGTAGGGGTPSLVTPPGTYSISIKCRFILQPRIHSDHADGALTSVEHRRVWRNWSRPQPVDTWLYGVARVREKMQRWEQVVMLAGAFGRPEPDLMPLQLPYHANDSWLALEYPADYDFDGDRLLYTAHFASAFDKTTPQCGLLIDEWTEVVPGETENTGITFHFDRPNAEPPQVLMLIVPPAFTGHWKWDDVLDALNDTLQRAQCRAVEPTQIDDTAYARFLPATIAAVTLYQISIMVNWAENNSVSQVVRVAHG